MAWTAGEGVILGGENRVQVLMGDTTSMTAADNLVGECVSLGGIGSAKSTTEYGGIHYLTKKKVVGQATPNDISITENCTQAQLTAIRTKYKNSSSFYFALAKPDGTVLYGCKASISQWGLEVPDGDTLKLSYNLAIQDDEAAITVTPPSP